jgi:hypothetical protein
LLDLTKHLTTRADDSHAAPVLSVYCYKGPFPGPIRDKSRLGKVLRVASN